MFRLDGSMHECIHLCWLCLSIFVAFLRVFVCGCDIERLFSLFSDNVGLVFVFSVHRLDVSVCCMNAYICVGYVCRFLWRSFVCLFVGVTLNDCSAFSATT